MHETRVRTARRGALSRRWLLAALAVGGFLAGGADAAQARVELLRWRQPDADGAERFHVHLGTSSRSYEETVDVGALTASAEGVYAVALSVPDASTVYVAVSAYNAAGASDLSNEKVRGAVGEGARARDGHRPGAPERPASLHVPPSRRLSVSWSEQAELHASLDPRAVPGSDGLELRGRLRIDEPGAGIGLTLRDPASADAYYWLGRDPEDGAAFTVASTVSALACTRALPAPEAGAWYRFRFAALPGARDTLVAAKVWLDGAREPKKWTACSDGSSGRLAGVVPGLWSVGAGVKAWERITVKPRRG